MYKKKYRYIIPILLLLTYSCTKADRAKLNKNFFEDVESLSTEVITEPKKEEMLTTSNQITQTTELPLETLSLTQTLEITNIPKKIEKEKIEKEIIPAEKKTQAPKTHPVTKKKKTIPVTPKLANLYVLVNYTGTKGTVEKGKPIKITSVVQTYSRDISSIDFQVYIRGKETKKDLLIGWANNILVFRDQSQFSLYWDGKYKGEYGVLKKGYYKIYVKVLLKNKNGEVLGEVGKLWGEGKYLIKLQ